MTNISATADACNYFSQKAIIYPLLIFIHNYLAYACIQNTNYVDISWSFILMDYFSPNADISFGMPFVMFMCIKNYELINETQAPLKYHIPDKSNCMRSSMQ